MSVEVKSGAVLKVIYYRIKAPHYQGFKVYD